MEIIWAIIEGLGILVDIFDIVWIVTDVISWIKGKENRIERKTAKKAGSKPPKRNRWNKAFIICLILVIVFTGLIVIRYLGKNNF
jgi:hypothetical protein